MEEGKLEPEIIQSEIDLLAAAMHIDRYLMDAMNRLDGDYSELNSLALLTYNQLSKIKHTLNKKILSEKKSPSDELTSNVENNILCNMQMEDENDTAKSKLQKLCYCCHSSFDYYEAIAEKSVDEAIKSTAQGLASSARERIDLLKQALGVECGCDLSCL